MINREIGSNERFCHMSKDAQLFYFFVLPYLDRDGLVKGHPAVLSGMAVPLHSDLRDKAGGLIGEWMAHGFAIRYEWMDGSVLFFPDFRRDNQHLKYEREQPSEFPPPPGFHRSPQGLIPDDGELAGRQAEKYDPRSKYHEALTEADTKGGDSPEDILSESGDATDDVRTTSGSNPDVVRTKGIEVEVEVKENGREENTTTNARALLTYARRLLLPEWNGGGDFLATLDDEDLLIAASWLWLYQKLKGEGEYTVNEYAARYKPSPFAGVDNPPGFIRRKVEKHTPVTLYFAHKAEFHAELRELKGAIQS
jgi:hypothetical protein